MNINKVSKVEYPKGKILDSFSNSNSKASTSKSDIITRKESKFNNSSNTHINEVKSRSLKSKKEVKISGVNSSNSTRKSSCNDSKSNADKEKKTIQERNHDVAGQSDREQSNQTQSPKAQSIPSMKSHTQKTKSPKKIHNQKSKVEKNEITKHPKCRKKDVFKDPPVATKKKEPRKKEHKASNPETCRMAETRKTHVSSEDVDKKKNNHHSYEPHSYTPIHHIRWEGHDDKELSGYNCDLCNKDLMCSPHDDDDHGYNEDGYYSDEYENEYEFTPSQILLPAVDILSCGHAFHSECARHIIPDEQSKDPQCVLCLSMA